MKLGLLLLFVGALSMGQQATPTVQLTPVPPKPTCVVILQNGACADLWRAYNQALQKRMQEELQLYVNRQKQVASEQATAPLQQQITELNNLINDQQEKIRNLQQQMHVDASAALQAKSDAHLTGLETGAAFGAGGLLFLLGFVVGIKRFAKNYSLSKKPLSPSASV